MTDPTIETPTHEALRAEAIDRLAAGLDLPAEILHEVARMQRCAREGCGHPADWHRHDDSATPGEGGHLPGGCSPTDAPGDPSCPFRCIGYDCRIDYTAPPDVPCTCPDFVPPTESISGQVYGNVRDQLSGCLACPPGGPHTRGDACIYGD